MLIIAALHTAVQEQPFIHCHNCTACTPGRRDTALSLAAGMQGAGTALALCPKGTGSAWEGIFSLVAHWCWFWYQWLKLLGVPRVWLLLKSTLSVSTSSSSCLAFPASSQGQAKSWEGTTWASNPNWPAGCSMLCDMLRNKNWEEGSGGSSHRSQTGWAKSACGQWWVSNFSSLSLLFFHLNCLYPWVFSLSPLPLSPPSDCSRLEDKPTAGPPHLTGHFCKKLHEYLKCSQSWIRMMFSWNKFKNVSSNFVLHCKHTVISSIYYKMPLLPKCQWTAVVQSVTQSQVWLTQALAWLPSTASPSPPALGRHCSEHMPQTSLAAGQLAWAQLVCNPRQISV